MSNNFKRFTNGIQIRPGFPADPVIGKLGEIYYNTTSNKLRVCVNISPLSWQDIHISGGTADGAILRWNDSAQSWEENTEIRTSGNSIFAESTPTGKDLQILAGEALGANEDGGELILSAGTPGPGGELGSVQIVGSTVRFDVAQTADPITGAEQEIYYNDLSKKFRYFDGLAWKNLEGFSSFYPIDLIDSSNLSLPATDATLIDGQTVLNGFRVLFTGLSIPTENNRVYVASVDGLGNIIWAVDSFGQDAQGEPVHGDTIFVKIGTLNENTFWFFDSTEWRSLDEILNVVGEQEVPTGIVDGINTVFTLSDNPIDENNLLVSINGLIVQQADYNFFAPNSIVFSTAPVPGQDISAFYLKRAKPAVGTFQGDIAVEYIELIQDNIDDGFVILASIPQNTNYVVLDVLTGTAKGPTEFGIDFSVVGQQLGWETLALDGVLVAGDKLRVWYLI